MSASADHRACLGPSQLPLIDVELFNVSITDHEGLVLCWQLPSRGAHFPKMESHSFLT
ncbi:hypothetical protein CCMA1212_002900 [Trichoderma ghanense]|uniref:Uncharacterized protein n=1 Tax=Trichoderma ghanense TaxID=65468 RepID=A0ABY2H8U9_9HYPO